VLPAHFLRTIRRSFHVDRLFGRPRSCGIIRWIILFMGIDVARPGVIRCFMWVILRWSHPLGHSLVPRFVRDLFVGFVVGVALRYFLLCGHFCPLLFSCGFLDSK
jgi:hypothetical protein